MKIKSAKSFRQWYKNLSPARQNAEKYWDENFIGAQHIELSGFFTMYHGDKTQVYDFLRKEVEMAEDGQAIYEFVQNAADSNSTHFYMFYDENYLVVINNGNAFSKEGLKSILNIGQSFGKNEPDKIGRYGIGFKLVHRLVGKSSGLDELLNSDNKGYRGPILFSWSEREQFNNFLSANEFDYVDFEDIQAPWLLKILITNFPAQPLESVKDVLFKDIEPFPSEELKNFQSFLLSFNDRIDNVVMDNGTVFFLKLGEGKYKYLEKQKQEYLNGLSTSMHFLKSLDTLVINENVVKKDKEATNVLEFVVENGSEKFNEIGLTEIRDKESNAKFKICFANNANSANEIKKHPNIYKYFPAVKEVNNLSFVIHSNLFELSSNRQNLTETPINKNLLRLLSGQIIDKMEVCKSENRSTFKNLFASILMSEESSSNSSGNGWQNEFFYNNLLSYIRKAIPTKDNDFSDNFQNVKINKLNLNLNLANFGLTNIQWFEWDNEADRLLIDEATKAEKLGIKEWDIRDIVENANPESINNWIATSDENTYQSFLTEIEKSSFLRDETKKKLLEIKLFKFSDDNFYSINDIWLTTNVRETYQERTYNQLKRAYETINKIKVVQKSILNKSIIFSTDKTINISNELQNLGFIVSLKNITAYKNIYSALVDKLPKEKDVYNTIAEKCKTNTLTVKEKKKLFLNFKNDETKFESIGDETLKKIHLFYDSQGNIESLSELISRSYKTYSWLSPYMIKSEEYFSELNSFLIQEDELFDEIILPNIEIIKDELTEAKEIKELVIVYKENHRPFFNEYIILKQSNKFGIIDKSDKHQIVPPNKETKIFIEANLSDNLIVLPYDFSDFNNEDGIIKGEDLHSQILELVDIDEHKETLVDIVKYKAKHKFLQGLSEFRFNSEVEYNKEDYEYKILDLACDVFTEDDYPKFKNNVVIETENQVLKLTEIPPFTVNIKIDDYVLSLAKILPDNYQNSDHLSSLINQFISLGLNKERIRNLFGVSEEPEPKDIFKMFSEKVETLKNSEQLAFLYLYGLYIEEIDFNQFKALNIYEEEIDLGTDKYLTGFDFIQQSEILHQKYRGVTKIFKDFPIIVDYADNLLLIKEPYFEGDKFICPYVKDDLSDEQRLSLIEFLFDQLNRKDKKATIKNIDWSKIGETETEDILGFNPTTSVYPSIYACESEVLPDYLIKWIGNEECKTAFLSDLGVWIVNSVVVELRKFFKGETKQFQNNRLAQETRFNEDETVLFNSFVWLKENELTLKTTEQFETFKKVVEVINENRTNNRNIDIQDEFDFDELEENSTKWQESYYENWKEESEVSIFLYDGELPKSISLDAIEDYVFYYFYEGNTAIDDDNNIYINENSDIKKELRKLELENEDFNFDGLWQNKLEVLEKENAQLRNSNKAKLGTEFDSEEDADFFQFYREGYVRVRAHWRSLPNRGGLSFNDYFLKTFENELQNYNGATLGTEFTTDISKNDQKEANREAKELVKEKLENEGFEFTEDIGAYSTIDGVFKDDVVFPLVVKSYKYQDEPLKIGANEWIQLMRPNSMFWAYFGNGKLGCLKLYELLRNQDKLTISFSTENLDKEDRLAEFAELLHYFGNVHFDFNSVKPSDYNVAKDLSDYRFNERRNEEDLRGDDENLL